MSKYDIMNMIINSNNEQLMQIIKLYFKFDNSKGVPAGMYTVKGFIPETSIVDFDDVNGVVVYQDALTYCKEVILKDKVFLDYLSNVEWKEDKENA